MQTKTLSLESIQIVNAYWASFFGCPVSALRPKRTVVLPAVDSASLYAMTFGAYPVVSVPATLSDVFAPTLNDWTPATIQSADVALDSLRGSGTKAVGPAWLGYADKTTIGGDPGGARMLDARDADAAESLQRACPPLEWEHGGSAFGDNPTAGTFVGSELVALAGYETWGAAIAHIAIVTRPDHRGRGYGRAAVARIARHALESGLVPQYRTLDSNHPSRRVAASLGFHHVATSLWIGLQPSSR